MAISNTMNWDVRTTGNDANGGGFKPGASGVNYAMQSSPQYTPTGLTTSGVSTTIGYAGSSADMVGNVINITGGTNFIAGWYEIVSELAGVSITLDRNCTTGIGASGTGNIGGSLLTIAKADSLKVTGSANVINIKSGTYTFTSRLTLVNVFSTNGYVSYYGYGSTWGDNGTKPLITTSTNSTTLFDVSNASAYLFRNLAFSNTAGTSSNAFTDPNAYGFFIRWTNCTFTGFTDAIQLDNIINWTGSGIVVDACYFTGMTATGSALKINGACVFSGNYVVGNANGYGVVTDVSGTGSTTIVGNVFYNLTYGVNSLANTPSARAQQNPIWMWNNNFVSCASDGFHSIDAGLNLVAVNNIFYGNGGYGINVANALPNIWFNHNAYGANTSGNLNNVTAGSVDVTLSGDPFTAKASNDFTLNNIAGAGAACRAAGYPGTNPAQTFGTGKIDIGALQHTDSGGSGSTYVFMIQ